MINKPLLSLVNVLALFAINAVQAQTINTNITNDWLDSRYTVPSPSDGTVTDTVTGLMWQQCSVGQSGSDCSGGSASNYTWQDALQLANTETTADYDDWRLPNKNELSSIVAYDRYSPSINTVAFPNTESTIYWSSSPNASDSGDAWLVYFGNGGVNGDSRYGNGRVRLVRSGQ